MTASGDARHDLLLFALAGSRDFGADVARCLDIDLAPHEERSFDDGEFKLRPLVNVRNRDVYVLHSLDGEPGVSSADKLCRLLFFIAALKDAGAQRVTAVTPYLCFQRKDRQTQPRDPVTSRYVAQLFEAMRVDRLITADAHNLAAFQNAFRCDTEHLDAQRAFADYVVAHVGAAPVAVVSPDLGGEKRAELFRARLEKALGGDVSKAFMDKRRSEGRVVGDIFAGDVQGRIAIVIDDLISGGGTMARVANACHAHGASEVWCLATHGVFSKDAPGVLKSAPIARLVVSDTVATPRRIRPIEPPLVVVSLAPLFARAIASCSGGGSIVALLDAN